MFFLRSFLLACRSLLLRLRRCRTWRCLACRGHPRSMRLRCLFLGPPDRLRFWRRRAFALGAVAVVAPLAPRPRFLLELGCPAILAFALPSVRKLCRTWTTTLVFRFHASNQLPLALIRRIAQSLSSQLHSPLLDEQSAGAPLWAMRSSRPLRRAAMSK